MWWIIIIGIVLVLFFIFNKNKNKSESYNQGSYSSSPSAENLFNDIYKDLSKSQREALLDLTSMFATHAGMSSNDMSAVNSIFVPYTHMLGFSKAETMKRWGNLSNFNPQDMISELKTIQEKGILDIALYTCFSLTCISNDPTTVQLLGGVFEQLGYTEEDIASTIQKIHAVGNMMN